MLTVQELIDMLRDGQSLGYSHGLAHHDVGIIAHDFRAVRIEGKYNLADVVRQINDRIEKEIARGANQPERAEEKDGGGG